MFLSRRGFFLHHLSDPRSLFFDDPRGLPNLASEFEAFAFERRGFKQRDTVVQSGASLLEECSRFAHYERKSLKNDELG